MPKRVKPNRVIPVPDLDACDRALARIAEITRRLAAVDAEFNRKVDTAKARVVEEATPLRAELEQLTNGIEAFGESHKAELFTAEKTKELPHGFIGFRLSTKISVGKKTLELLKQFKMVACVRITETPDKEALAELPDAKLAQVGAKRVSEDKFWFEIKDEEVARAQS